MAWCFPNPGLNSERHLIGYRGSIIFTFCEERLVKLRLLKNSESTKLYNISKEYIIIVTVV